jgi:hypothetical protein
MKNQKKSRFISDKKWIIAILMIAVVSYAAISVAKPMEPCGKPADSQLPCNPAEHCEEPADPQLPCNPASNPHKPDAPKDPIFHLFQLLDLTDAQRENILEYSVNTKKKIVQLKADIKILQIDKNTAMKNENYKQAKKLIDKIATKRASIAKLQITQKENISNVLTDEQKEQLKEKMMDCKRPNLDKKHRKLDKKR